MSTDDTGLGIRLSGVGLGLVPPYQMGRVYRDMLGRANQRLAKEADEVLWMVAGIPAPIQQFR